MVRAPIRLALPIALLLPSQGQAQAPSKEMAQAAAAYAAKITASAIFVSGRTLESVLDQELAPTRPLEMLIKPLLRFDVDEEGRSVTCRLGQAKATARCLPALGCTLVTSADAPSKARRNLAARTLPAAPPAAAIWPLGERVGDDHETGIDRDKLSETLDRAFAEPNPKKPVHTRAVVVVHKGRIVAERYAPGFHRTMPLPGWSMTKTLTNALIGKRIGEGKLRLAQPARPASDADRSPAPTLRNLLSMTAGIQWNEDYDDPNSHALRMLFGSADHAAVYAALPQTEAAGARFQYASGSTNLCCRLLRASFASDEQYWRYPGELFDAIGMRTAVLETDPSGTFVGSSYCYASARDWARLGLLFLQDGVFRGTRILPEGWVAQSTKDVPASHGRYGYQIWLNRDPDGDGERQRKWPDLPEDLFSMDGHEGQYCVISPAAELVIVRMGCTKSGGFDLHGLLREVHAAVDP